MAVKQKNGYGWGKEEKDDLETNKCRNEMCEVHQKDSKWTEYLDFGPHGLSVIRNAGAHKVRVSIGGLRLNLGPRYENGSVNFNFPNCDASRDNLFHRFHHEKIVPLA